MKAHVLLWRRQNFLNERGAERVEVGTTTMKPSIWVPFAALAILLASGCHKPSSEVAKQIAELERKTSEAVARQQELEQQIADQKLAAERDAIERERMQIEEDRLELERQQDDAAAAEVEKLRQREEALATREGKLEQQQATLEDKQGQLDQRDQQLSERDRERAGSEALDFKDEGDPQAPVADYGMFYDSLSSYGSWFETPDYGYVWQPVIVRDTSWRPYSRGRWVCSDHGWTWISDEPFGWATYHYGRWAPLRGHGWVWVPGCEWAPSWVSWRYSDSHVGWAPLPPETLAYRGHHWDSSVDVTFGIGALWFNFVEIRHFGGPVNRHCLPYSQNNIFIQQTVNITNIHVKNRQVICGGPRYRDVCERGGRPVPFYRLDMDRRGRPGNDPLGMQPQIHGDRLRVSAPNMDVAWNEGLQPKRVKERLESITVERPEALRPEITERFRQSRVQDRSRAELSIIDLGGREKFNQRRTEQLEVNRRQADEAARASDKARATDKKLAQGNGANEIDRKRGRPDQAPQQTRNEQARQRQQEQVEEASNESRITPPKDPSRQRLDATARQQQLQQQAAQYQRDAQRDQALKQQQQETAKAQRDQARQLQEQQEAAQYQRDAQRDQALKQQQQEAAKAQRDQARQLQEQQEAAKAQRDQARQLQQQQEAAQYQRDAQRDQALKQELQEAAKAQREQARQQQQEQQREQARQQQQEQQREQARQQQDAQKQQQQQQDDEEKKRGRNR